MAPGWVRIVWEDFEGDVSPRDSGTPRNPAEEGSGRPAAPRESCRAHGGRCEVRGALAAAQMAASCHAVPITPNKTTTQLIFGPFDLSDAKAAEVQFWSWVIYSV